MLWIHASSAARFESSVRDTLEQLKVPGRTEAGANVFQLFRNWLRDGKRGKWLIILDNVDDACFLLEPPTSTPQVTSAVQVGMHGERHLDYLPAASHGSMLVTSRSELATTEIVDRFNIVSVEPMSEGLAVELARKKLRPGCREKDMVQLVSALGGMPLAISQAAAYIDHRRPRCSVQEYVERLQKADSSGLSPLDFDAGDLRRDREASNSIFLTWQISFEHIHKSRPSAADLLSLMSFFDRSSIPEPLLHDRDLPTSTSVKAKTGWVERILPWRRRKGEAVMPDEARKDNTRVTRDELEKDVIILRSYSFISIAANATRFEMHRLVQLAMQKWLTSHGRLERWGSQFIRNLDSAFPPSDYEDWTVCRSLFPHALAALKLESLHAATELQRASLLTKSGSYAKDQGVLDVAESMQSLATTVYMRALGKEHSSTLTSMSNLALTYSAQERQSEAEELQVMVMETEQRLFGREHQATLTSMGNLAVTYRDQGRLDKAMKLIEQVMSARLRTSGENHPQTLVAMANAARTYRALGRRLQAEEIQAGVVKRSLALLGSEHPDTLVAIGELANTYRLQGRLNEAEKLEMKVMEVRKKVLGDGHPHTLTSMGHLASTCRENGRLDKAEKLNKEMLEISGSMFGEDHPSVLQSMTSLATTYWKQGRSEEAERLEVKVIEARKRVFGDHDLQTLASMSNLASTYRGQGRYNEAEKLEVEVLKAKQESLGERYLYTLISMADLASTYMDQGRLGEAEKLEVQVLETRKRVLGRDHHITLTSISNLV